MTGLLCLRAALLWALAWAPTSTPPDVAVSIVVHPDLATEADPDALREHIFRELQLRGLRPALAELGPLPPEAGLDGVAVPDHALAVWVDVAADGLTTIVVARAGETEVIRTSHREPPGPHMGSQLALLVAEPVEAWIERDRAPPPTPASVSIVAAAVRPVPRRPWLALGADVGVVWPIRETTPIAAASVRVGYVPHRRITLLLASTLPLHEHRTRSPSGAVRSLPFVFGGLATVDVLHPAALVRFDLEGGFSAVALRVDVDPAEGRRGRATTPWTGAAHGGVRLRVPVHRRVDLAAGVSLLAPVSPVTLRTEGAVAQRWGPVWMNAAIGAAARL